MFPLLTRAEFLSPYWRDVCTVLVPVLLVINLFELVMIAMVFIYAWRIKTKLVDVIYIAGRWAELAKNEVADTKNAVDAHIGDLKKTIQEQHQREFGSSAEYGEPAKSGSHPVVKSQ